VTAVSETTVVEQITALRAEGYDGDVGITPEGELRCGACGHLHRPEDVVIERTARFEGESDPDDEAVVFGLRCRVCSTRAVLVAAYGPTASAEEAAVIPTLLHRPAG
jgi:hypothetical protein